MIPEEAFLVSQRTPKLFLLGCWEFILAGYGNFKPKRCKLQILFLCMDEKRLVLLNSEPNVPTGENEFLPLDKVLSLREGFNGLSATGTVG